jgi:hypothetical protein
MRIAFSPKRRIAAGLLLAALLSIVGYRVFRRWVSHGPEALLERADEMSWLVRTLRLKPAYSRTEQKLAPASNASSAIAASMPIRASERHSVESARHVSIVDLLLTPILTGTGST